MSDALELYKRKTVVVTGGLGFIGSTLALRLAGRAGRVVVVDNLSQGQGGNRRNLEDAHGAVALVERAVGDRAAMREVLQGADVVFHLAGQNSHLLGLRDPRPDIAGNVEATGALLSAVADLPRPPVVVYTGTRGQYGRARRLPVDEEHPCEPLGVYEKTKLEAERLMQACWRERKVRTVPLRLTNVYGPRSQMRYADRGVVNWFIRRALEGLPIELFGTGKIVRDFLYVDDCVEALLAAGLLETGFGEPINVGSGRPSCYLEVAKIVERLVPGAARRFVAFDSERAAIEPGDFYADVSRAKERLGWKPAVGLEEGLRRTVEFYRERLADYVAP